MKFSGFTLIELVIVITILATLAAVAIPTYQNLQRQAKNEATKGVVGSVRSAIILHRMNEVVAGRPDAWPDGDRVRDVADGGTLSGHVMTSGDLPSNPWARDADLVDPDSMTWWFACNSQGALIPGGDAWVYDQCDGRFWANTAVNGGGPGETENHF